MTTEFIPQMADCVEREALTNALDELCDRVCRYSKKQRSAMCGACPLGDAFDVVEALPAADVRPVVRGKWERMSDNDVFGDIHCKCSACGEDWWQGPGWFRHANFCPNCGADMRNNDN